MAYGEGGNPFAFPQVTQSITQPAVPMKKSQAVPTKKPQAVPTKKPQAVPTKKPQAVAIKRTRRPCEALPGGCKDDPPTKTAVPTKKPQAVPIKRTRRPCEALPGGCKDDPPTNTAAKKPPASKTFQIEIQENQKAMKELQLALDAEKLARQQSEAARKDCESAREDCETIRSKCESKNSQSTSGIFNLNTRADLQHVRKTSGIQSGGKKGLEQMLKQERSACGFRKQLSSSCKECIYSALKGRDEKSCRKELRKLLKKMNSCQIQRIDRSTALELLSFK